MKRISGRLGLIFVSFLLLVMVAVGGTAWGLRAQAADALTINLAGRQRMLVQWMTRLAAARSNSALETAALDEAIGAFDATLDALQFGGEVRYPDDQVVTLPAAADPAIRAQLARVESGWQNFRALLDALRSAGPGSPQSQSAQAGVDALAPDLLAQADLLARLYQAQADRRIASLSRAQAGFFAAAALPLLGGVWVARRSILRPLHGLEAAAARIGAGDLETPVAADGPLEMAALAGAFDSMRHDLLAARDELLAWNQTLEARVDERTRELEALYKVMRDITSRLEPGAVFRSVTDQAQALLDADAACLCLLDDSAPLLRLRSLSGPEDAALHSAVESGNPLVCAVLSGRAAQHCPPGGCETCGVMATRYRASHLAVPLWVEQRRIGALCVGSCGDAAFGADAPRLLERLAGAAAIAIENARLYRQAERLSALEERQRIAAEMHDGLAQTIDSIGLLVDQAGDCLDGGDAAAARRSLGQAYERIRRASGEVRASISSLEDEPPQRASLQKRLAELAAQEKLEARKDLVWQVSLPGAVFLPIQDARNVLGVAREALTNARRHSGAGRISMRLEIDDGAAALAIEDDGRGFDPCQAPDDGRRHFGLKILHARAAQLGGRLQVLSAPESGTSVTLRWPLKEPGSATER